MSFKISKRGVIILGALCLVFTLLVITLRLINSSSDRRAEEGDKSSITPSPQLNPLNRENPTGIEQSEEYKKSFQETEQQQKQFSEREAAVGQLIHKLPHNGQYFSMDYSFEKNQYTVAITSANRAKGDDELTTFLRANNIQDRSWIRNLTVVYQ